jgi:tRNA threonylcarbamoyladenosine biosynthesis protein TsaB
MLDARRDDVYMAVYDVDNNMVEKDIFATADVVFSDMQMAYSVKNVYFGGPGSLKVEFLCLNTKFGIVIEKLICLANNISDNSYKRFINGTFEDLAYFEPFYLKEFEGRIKIS